MSIVIAIVAGLLGWGVYELVRRTHIPPIVAVVASIVLVIIVCVIEPKFFLKFGGAIGFFYGSWFFGYYEARKAKRNNAGKSEGSIKEEKNVIPYQLSDSMLIESGQTLRGVIDHKNGHNLFRIVLTQPGSLSMKVTTDDEDGLPNWEVHINVLDGNGKKISTSGRFEFPYSSEVELPNADTYIIEIKSSKTGKYYLMVSY